MFKCDGFAAGKVWEVQLLPRLFELCGTAGGTGRAGQVACW